MFSIDTETGFRDAVLINAAYGLGENVVQGAVNPDEYYVFKPTLKTGLPADPAEALGSKEFKLVYDVGGGKMTRTCPCRRKTAAGSRSATTTSSRWPAGPASSRTTTAASAAGRRRWTWSGPRTAAPASCSSCRPGPKRAVAARATRAGNLPAQGARENVLVRAAASARRSPRARAR
jgi:hypothetical protein